MLQILFFQFETFSTSVARCHYNVMIMHDKAMYNNIMYEIKTVKHTRKRKMEKSNNKKNRLKSTKKTNSETHKAFVYLRMRSMAMTEGTDRRFRALTLSEFMSYVFTFFLYDTRASKIFSKWFFASFRSDFLCHVRCSGEDVQDEEV